MDRKGVKNMINSFKDNEARDSGVIYKSTFEQIKKLYTLNPAQAGELAISAIELLLTGDISSDDIYISLMLEDRREVNKRNQEKYDKRVEANKESKKQEMKLEEIAALHKQKMTQSAIGKRIGITQGAVSKRLTIIKTEFPELLQDDYSNYSKNSSNDNVNDNDNDIIGTNIASDIPSSTSESKLSLVSSPEEKKFVF